MKRIVSIACLFLCAVTGISAQDKGIKFEDTKVWQQILEKAMNEDKLIFVDCYAEWCAPCKVLATNVFTQGNVGDFFNSNFINAQFEMERDADGIAHKEAWGVSAYPTLLFIDPQTGTVVHRLVGAGQADWLLEGAKTAMTPSMNLHGLALRYDSGERAPEFIAMYMDALGTAYMAKEQEKVAVEYLSGKSLDELATLENWGIIRDNIKDPLSGPMRMILENRERFYAIEALNPNAVDQLLTNNVLEVVKTLTSDPTNLDSDRYDEVVAYYSTLDFPTAGHAVYWLNSAKKAYENDWDSVLSDIKVVDADPSILGNISGSYFMAMTAALAASNDREIIMKGIGMLDGRIGQIKGNAPNALFFKANFSHIKSSLYKAAGDEAAAEKAFAEAEEFGIKYEAAVSGR